MGRFTERELSHDELRMQWMAHGLLLARRRLETCHRGIMVDDVVNVSSMERQVRVLSYCLNNHEKAHLFRGVAAVWWVYMWWHAELTIDYYRSRISKSMFHEASMLLLRERDVLEKHYVGVPWMLQLAEVEL